jgi:hypothetical protein
VIESVLSVENLRMIESINESKRGDIETSSSWREFASSMLDQQISPPGRPPAHVQHPRPGYPVQSIQPVPWHPQHQRATSDPIVSNTRSHYEYPEDETPPISRSYTDGWRATDRRG